MALFQLGAGNGIGRRFTPPLRRRKCGDTSVSLAPPSEPTLSWLQTTIAAFQ